MSGKIIIQFMHQPLIIINENLMKTLMESMDDNDKREHCYNETNSHHSRTRLATSTNQFTGCLFFYFPSSTAAQTVQLKILNELFCHT